MKLKRLQSRLSLVPGRRQSVNYEQKGRLRHRGGKRIAKGDRSSPFILQKTSDLVRMLMVGLREYSITYRIDRPGFYCIVFCLLAIACKLIVQKS